MTEEINHSYDGGLFAELIQNRTFQDPRPRGRQDRAGPAGSLVCLIGDGKASHRSQPIR